MAGTFIPYNTVHINLKETHSFSNKLKNDLGNYLIFWWDIVPLGQLFFQPGELPDEKTLLQKVNDSISPTIKFYKSRTTTEDIIGEPPGISPAYLDPVFSSLLQSQEINRASHVDLSVVICTRNRAQHISACLDSLLRMHAKPKEIIVVDNAPDDDSTKEIVSRYSDVLYVTEPRAGLDIARNKGIMTASSELVAYVDDDVVVHPLWSYQICQPFKDPAIGASTGLVFAAKLETEAQMIFERHWSFNRGYIEKKYIRNILSKQPPPVWEIGAGANMAFRRSVFSVAGLFDERLDAGAAGCNGDSEMWFRILLNDFTIFYNPLAIVYHEHRSDMKGLKKQLFNYMRGFTTAALIQQQQHNSAGYKKHLMFRMPYYYFKLTVLGFPRYRFRFRTVFHEIAGVVSGIFFYLRHRKKKGYDFV